MKTQANVYKGLGGYGTLGFEIVLSFLIGVFGGKWLDDRYGTTPWFFLGGLVLGSVLSIKAILRAMKLMRQVAEKEEREEGNPKPLYESTSERLERKKRGEKIDDDPVVEDEGAKLRLKPRLQESASDPSERTPEEAPEDEDGVDSKKDS